MRAGRKRKLGYRKPSGRLRPEAPAVNYLALTANQPHRRLVADADRLSAWAGTALGRLRLWRVINEPQYMAGEEYARAIGAYLATVSGPRSTAGSGRSGDCNPELCLADDRDCTCVQKLKDYTDLYDVVADVGRDAQIAIKRLICEDVDLGLGEQVWACRALTALARHMKIRARG
jgi:hypothetical protein